MARYYSPENIQFGGCIFGEKYKDLVGFVGHQIYMRNVIFGNKINTPVEIKRQYVYNLFPYSYRLVYSDVINHFFQRDWYSKGEKCYGYCWKDYSFASCRHKLIVYNDLAVVKRMKERLSKSRGSLLWWIERQLKRIKILDINDDKLNLITNNDMDKFIHHKNVIHAINSKMWFVGRDSTGRRVHSNLSNLPRRLKPYLVVDGQRLSQIDICNSQLLFLSKYVEDHRFRDLCEKGEIYDYIANKGNWSRDYVKEQIIKQGLFCKSTSPYNKTPVMKRLYSEFPLVHDYLNKVKHPKRYKFLSHKLQSDESHIVIDRTCGRIKKEKPNTFVGTIHDAILCSPSDIDYICEIIMKECYEARKLIPKLKIEHY